jgi:hypothetical protein
LEKDGEAAMRMIRPTWRDAEIITALLNAFGRTVRAGLIFSCP